MALKHGLQSFHRLFVDDTKYDAIERVHKTSPLLHQQVEPDLCDHADMITMKHPGTEAAKHDGPNTLLLALEEEQDPYHALAHDPLNTSSRVQVGPIPGHARV